MHLRKVDLKQTNRGNWDIFIHEDFDGNSVKNSNSIRDVPLIGGAYGFDHQSFLAEVVEKLDSDLKLANTRFYSTL
ncbi:hypothetical protein C942_04418 [Photobacterium marinum]|uniref:Uncharacterized protein n=1 Tax=Photobacterium marinum TaxID=1056511 RepID=L8JD27_9GAMM|nr:hypothetical protein C942_04418 [Photobacterium marinum]